MKTSIFYLLVIFLGSSLLVQAQMDGTPFPKLTGETAKDEVITIPDDTRGKYTLIGLAHTKKAEDDLNSWLRPVYNTFITKPSGIFAAFGYDVNVYFVPMFTGIKSAAMKTAKRKAAKKTDPELLPYILFFKGSLNPYEEVLEMNKKSDEPHFFVLDPNGKIVYATKGKYSDRKMQEVEAAIE